MHDVALDQLPELYRSAAVRMAERIAIDRYGLSEDDLMARAGLAAWRCLLERWPQAQRIGIACGPGNNGGDGYVLAEWARASGRQVQVLSLHDAVKPGAAERAAETYLHNGGRAMTFHAEDGLPDADVWVDALFGIGLHRALDGAAADLVRALNRVAAPLLALDVPSGVDADNGHVENVAVRATFTLSFICGKPGLYTGRGRNAAGEVRIERLGLDDSIFDDSSSEGLEPSARLAQAGHLSQWLRPRARDAHKGHFGHVLCIGGDHGYGGAIALCAEAAHRAGAGLVSVATRAEHVAMLLTRRPECMARAIDDIDALRPLLEKADVLAIGPGLGQGEWGLALLEATLSQAKRTATPVVLDADALNMLSRRDPMPLPQAVLTPHPGEAARLLSTTTQEIERDRAQAARRLATRYDATVVLKGAGTLVAASGQAPVVIDAGNPGMASGGMGDALTGAIAAMLAQCVASRSDATGEEGAKKNHAVFTSVVCGTLLHSAAADAAAHEGGECGLLASDLFPYLRRLSNPVGHE
jgi:ADP-dependent NAD(P)H-hydrate dehydratase / NAD(P)H-hydrate epimerase